MTLLAVSEFQIGQHSLRVDLQVHFCPGEERFLTLDVDSTLCCWVTANCNQLFSLAVPVPTPAAKSIWRTGLAHWGHTGHDREDSDHADELPEVGVLPN